MNTIEFRKTECEEWMLEYGVSFGVAVIIDGEDLNDKLARCNTKGIYDPGHQDARRLWGNLHNALIPGTYDYKCGAFICCCKSCGDECCDGTDVRVHEDELHVYWDQFSPGCGTVDYSSLSFVFDKTAYDKEMEKLRAWCDEEDTLSKQHAQQQANPLGTVSSIDFVDKDWGERTGCPSDRLIAVSVNGEDLNTLLRHEGKDIWQSKTLTATEVYRHLTDALCTDSMTDRNGALVGLLVGIKGETIRIRAHVTQNQQYVYWSDFYTENGTQDFSSLFFRFDRNEYEKAMDKLARLARK